MKNLLFFLKNFINDPQSVGAVSASSKQLAIEICSKLPKSFQGGTIAEFGPGTGVFTSQILSLIDSSSRFFAIEKNQMFYEQLKETFPNIELYNMDVRKISSLNNLKSQNYIDYIVSGLPWANFPPNIQSELLEATFSSLNSKGVFSTFTYISGYFMPNGKDFRNKLKQKFSKVETSKIVWRNFPPAMVYHCHKD